MPTPSKPEAEPEQDEILEAKKNAPKHTLESEFHRVTQERDALKNQIADMAQKEDQEAHPQDDDSIRKIMFDHIRGPIGKVLKYGPAVALPPLVVPALLGHTLLKKTPILRSLYPSGTIERLSGGVRDGIAKIITLPLAPLSIPGNFVRGLMGKPGVQDYAGSLGRGLGKFSESIGRAFRTLWAPGRAVGFIDGTIERVTKAGSWTLKHVQEAATGLTKVAILPFTATDKALSSLGISGPTRTIAVLAIGGGAVFFGYPALLGSAKVWLASHLPAAWVAALGL